MAENDPITRFVEWFEKAKASEPNLPNAVSLATVGADAQPSLRMVLLKHVDDQGFVFYTNLESRKGVELAANPRAALLFHWKSLKRQVRIEGPAEAVSDAEADAYFASRDRGAQLGAWASDQSRPMAGRFDLEKRVAKFTAQFGIGTVQRPPFWSGYRIAPRRMEFWSEGKFRLHEREQFVRDGAEWRVERLFP
ncbi:MAG: pyridoxamine 5'-phosphate oxidase [Alphaproteobacteria bacterium]|nr:pyridoxamine 5'-phosphate oxidase [Alphaproteobacteria bacterium]